MRMNSAICVIEAFGVLVLVAAALIYLFNPAVAKKVIKASAVWLGVLLGCLMALSYLVQEHPIAFAVSILIVSPIAYIVRERRAVKSVRQRSSGPLERTPVAPKHFRGDDA